jgi:hypothetical protein
VDPPFGSQAASACDASEGGLVTLVPSMTRYAAPAVSAVLAAALAVSQAGAASALPSLRTAISQRGHVVVTFSLGELAPGRIVVAVGPATRADGRLVTANIRLDEPLGPVQTAAGYRARTRHVLAPGTYFVQVSGTVLGLDCMKLKPWQCQQDWSNLRRVRVPRP